MKKIGIVIGSIRSNRVGDTVGKWFYNNSGIKSLNAEIIDLKKINLPFYDEDFAPMALQGNYKTEAGKSWYNLVKQYDSFVFVTPEYNFGVPASLKNAIDYIYPEWNSKPAMVLSYGFRGGEGSSEALRTVIGGGKSPVTMKLTQTHPKLFLKKDILNERGQFKDIETDFQQYIPEVQKAVEELKELINNHSK